MKSRNEKKVPMAIGWWTKFDENSMKYLDTKIATRKKVGVLILTLLSTSFERVVQIHDALQSSKVSTRKKILAKIFENLDYSNVKASGVLLA